MSIFQRQLLLLHSLWLGNWLFFWGVGAFENDLAVSPEYSVLPQLALVLQGLLH